MALTMVVLTVAAILHANEATGFRQPAEFEPQAAVWLSASLDNPESMKITAQMVTNLLPYVAVKMVIEDEPSLAGLKEKLKLNGINPDAMQFFTTPLATFMLRDAAVFLADGKGKMSVLDLQWSDYGLPGWCKRLYPTEPQREAKCVGYLNAALDGLDRWIAEVSHATLITSSLFLENAAFEVNGKGVLLISEPLALERNPGRSREEIGAALREIPGITKVIWLGHGLAQDPLERSTIAGPFIGLGAAGHTDEFVRFADASTILLAWPDEAADGEHPVAKLNRERMQKSYDILAHATDQAGQPFRILKVPLPTTIEKKVTLAGRSDTGDGWNEFHFPAAEGRKAGDKLIHIAAASYLNLIIANKIVLVPSYVEDGTPPAAQDRVCRILESAFPGRSIRFIRATPLNWHGGGLHCASLSEPRSN